MSIGIGVGIAQSGLQVASLELAVSANNVANALTDGFVPSRVEERALPGGGVSGGVQQEPDPLDEVRADRALLAPSRTDLVQELLAQSKAAAVYRANLASLRTIDESVGAILDMAK
jgi:Flagella basal body rod protein